MTDDSGGEGEAISRSQELGAPLIPHYYGDTVRRIFVGAAAGLLILSPFAGNEMPGVLGIGVAFALMLALLAAITNPQKQWSMIANAVASGIGVILAEVFALASFSAQEYLAFLVSEAFVIAFLFALYFSVKTVRSMVMQRIGKKGAFGEFQTDDQA